MQALLLRLLLLSLVDRVSSSNGADTFVINNVKMVRLFVDIPSAVGFVMFGLLL